MKTKSLHTYALLFSLWLLLWTPLSDAFAQSPQPLLGPGQLNNPSSIAPLGPDRWALTLPSNSQIAILDRQSQQIEYRKVRGYPWLAIPREEGELFIADPLLGKIYLYDRQQLLHELDHPFNFPSGMWFDAKHNTLYVLERHGHLYALSGPLYQNLQTIATGFEGANFLVSHQNKLYTIEGKNARLIEISLTDHQLKKTPLPAQFPNLLSSSQEALYIGSSITGEIWKWDSQNYELQPYQDQEIGLSFLLFKDPTTYLTTNILNGQLHLFQNQKQTTLSPAGAYSPNSLFYEPIERLFLLNLTPIELSSTSARPLNASLLPLLYTHPTPLSLIRNIVVTKEGQLYFSNSDGELYHAQGENLHLITQGLDDPSDLVITRKGLILCLERSSGQLTAILKDGKPLPLIVSFDRPQALLELPGERGFLVSDQGAKTIYYINHFQPLPLLTQLNSPGALALMEEGHFAYIDEFTKEIIKVNLETRKTQTLYRYQNPQQEANPLLAPPQNPSEKPNLIYNPHSKKLYLSLPQSRELIEVPE